MLNYKEMSNEELISFMDTLSADDNLSTSELNAILAEVTNRNIDKSYINKITDLIYTGILQNDNHRKTIKDRRKEAKETQKLKRKLEKEATFEEIDDVEEIDNEEITEVQPEVASHIEESADATMVFPVVSEEAPKKKDKIDEYFEALDEDDDYEEDIKVKEKKEEPYPILSFTSSMCAVVAWIMFVAAVVISCFAGFKYFGTNPLMIMVMVVAGFVVGTVFMLLFYCIAEKIQLMLSIEDSLYKLTKDK